VDFFDTRCHHHLSTSPMRETEPEVDYFRHLMPLTSLHLPRTQEQDRGRFFFNIQCGQRLSTSLACKIDIEAGSFRLSTLSLPLLPRMQERDRCVSFECCQHLSTSLARKVETDAGCFQLLTLPPPPHLPRMQDRDVDGLISTFDATHVEGGEY